MKGSGMATTIAVVSGKGGVGKTSLASNVLYTLARLGRLVLGIDLDSNPGLSMELGLKGSAQFDDGAGLMAAMVTGGVPPLIKRGEELHILPGGVSLKALPGMEDVWRARGQSADTALRDLLAPMRRSYDFIVIDTPPGGQGNAAQLALGAADYCLIPTRSDNVSLQGVSDMAMMVRHAQQNGNPNLTVLGVVLFDLDPKATVENREAREHAEHVMGGVAPVLMTEIRESKKAARQARNQGMAVLQYDEEVVAGAKPWYEDPSGSSKIARRAGKLAVDYVTLTTEIVRLIEQHEAERVSAVAL